MSLITNISYDHQALLGGCACPQIAGEKAGIIKPGVPVVVSQTQPEVAGRVCSESRCAKASALVFADPALRSVQLAPCREADRAAGRAVRLDVQRRRPPYLHERGAGPAGGDYQRLNLPGVLAVLDELRAQGFALPEAAVRQGLREVAQPDAACAGAGASSASTPLVVCRHGPQRGRPAPGAGAIAAQQLPLPAAALGASGAMNDKDVAKVVGLLPAAAYRVTFCQAGYPAGPDPAPSWRPRAAAAGLTGQAYGPVPAGRGGGAGWRRLPMTWYSLGAALSSWPRWRRCMRISKMLI
ncbi:MAG: hypothetical protein WKG07_29800 [Hymenobacter sp.]